MQSVCVCVCVCSRRSREMTKKSCSLPSLKVLFTTQSPCQKKLCLYAKEYVRVVLYKLVQICIHFIYLCSQNVRFPELMTVVYRVLCVDLLRIIELCAL